MKKNQNAVPVSNDRCCCWWKCVAHVRI